MPFRIGIDARMIGPVMTGLGRYALSLARYVPALDPANRYVIIRRRHAAGLGVNGGNVEEAIVGGDLDQPANLFAARAINRLGLDLYHSLYDFVPPGLRAGRVALTLHDLTWLEQPDLCFDERFAWMKARVTHAYARLTMPYAARRADRVIAPSAHTRDRAVAVLGLDPARVSVIHHGVDAASFPPSASNGNGRATSGDRFFLCLGNTKPYKNTRAALSALAIVAARDPDVRLVVTGRGDSRRNLERLAAQLGIEDRVVFTGPVGQDRLLALLHSAVALVFPSLVEGFGLPLVEAMSAGCPVVASNAPTVAEICGDAALLPDPRSVADIADAMGTLLEDEARRQALRARGLARAAQFTWPRCAEQTLAVYRACLEDAR